MKEKKSNQLFKRAETLLPGGVNSPVRAFRSVGGIPKFIEKAKGAYLYDVDKNQYIDYVGSWGPMIVGHAHPKVIQAIRKSALNGTSFGAPNPYEVELAEKIRKIFPSIEKVRMTNSGTEAVMGAIRVARAFTKRDKIIKFEGCYHGHADYLLVKAGSGALTFGVPTSAGVPSDFAKHTLTARFNDLESVKRLFESNNDVIPAKAGIPQVHSGDSRLRGNDSSGKIAAIILEPVVGNSGCILPQPEFLQGLRDLCHRQGALLIFDEVMTGFRVALGGAQEKFKVKPDLTVLGKVIGGGLPVGAFGGRAEIMNLLAPLGPVYQAGTLSGNPLAMVAGIETLKLISKKGFYKQLEKKTDQLAKGLQKAAKRTGISIQTPHIGGMLSLFFSDHPIFDLDSAMQSDSEKFKKFFHGMLERGIYLPPSPFEAWFVSAVHKKNEMTRTLKAANDTFREMS